MLEPILPLRRGQTRLGTSFSAFTTGRGGQASEQGALSPLSRPQATSLCCAIHYQLCYHLMEERMEKMNIIERKLNDVTVLDLEGNLALEDNAQFRKRATAVIDAGARKLIVNMARVKYMDSSGLGELISCYTAMQKLSGTVKLLHLNDRLRNLLVITKLTRVFETFDSEPAAVASFSQ
jgi:anti-sigma B factor antagonist